MKRKKQEKEEAVNSMNLFDDGDDVYCCPHDGWPYKSTWERERGKKSQQQ